MCGSEINPHTLAGLHQRGGARHIRSCWPLRNRTQNGVCPGPLTSKAEAAVYPPPGASLAPPSERLILFLLMTLGPMIALLPLAERISGPVANALLVFGRVPMFYYLVHIPVIHALALIVSLIRQGSVTPWLFGNHPMQPPEEPPGYMWSLGLLYLVFGVAIAILYPLCVWYAGVKARRRESWVRYI